MHLDEPQGLIWDSENYSCAYDSLFSILWNIWQEDATKWSQIFSGMSARMSNLVQGFTNIDDHVISIERLRNNLRQSLHQDFPDLFPYGHQGASVVELAEKMFHNEVPNTTLQLQCSMCDFFKESTDRHLSLVIHGVPRVSATTRDQLRTTLVNDSRELCPECVRPLEHIVTFYDMPKILIFSVSEHNIVISHTINVRTANGINKYYLKGIIYHGGFHFTARIIRQDQTVWFHDGQLGRNCLLESPVKKFSVADLNYCNDRNACLAIYTQD